MAAGLVTIPVLDANGVARNMQFWSSDGTATGTLSPSYGVLGAGAVSAGVPRVTLPSDDPAVTALALLHTDNITTRAGFSASATFTPAASSHTTPACNGAAGTFAFSAPSGKAIMITDANLLINGGTAEASAWRLYLYNVTPPSALTDTTTFDLPSGDQASFLGYVDLGTAVDLGSTQWIQNTSVNKAIQLSGTSAFGYLVNLTTITPAAVAHTVTLIGTPL